MPRILSVWSPNWPIATWRRKNPSGSPADPPSRGRGTAKRCEEAAPFALIATERGVRRLYAVDEAAAALGLYVGQKATDAMALVPELAAADADPAGDLAALEALVLWCVRFSPAVAARSAGRALARRQRRRPSLGRRAGDAGRPPGPAGAAGHSGARRHRRLGRRGLGAGQVRRGSRGRPAGRRGLSCWRPCRSPACRLEPETAAQLMRLGLVRIGQLAALPRGQLARRFGQAVLTRLDQALGAGPRRRSSSSVPPRPGSRASPSPSRSARRRTSRAPAATSPSASARGWRPRAGRAALRARLPPAGRPRRAACRRPVAARPRARGDRAALRADAGDASIPASGSRW